MALDVWSYSGLVKGFVQGNQLDTALQILTEMRSAGVKPNEVKIPLMCWHENVRIQAVALASSPERVSGTAGCSCVSADLLGMSWYDRHATQVVGAF